MKPDMRVPILLICSALITQGVNAQSLSEADREALLERLEDLRNAAEGSVEAKLRIALAAYRNAIGDDDAAIDLYLNCTERLNFDEKEKKSSDFREWRRKKADELSDPAFRVALRLQLRWLVLTLMAADKDADRDKLAVEARQVLDSIFSVPDKLRGQEGVLGDSALSTVFARAYEISHIKVEDWPASPIDVSAIYEDLIMPPLRNPSQVKELQAAWIRRINQEGAMAEIWNTDDGKDKKPANGNPRPDAYEKFVEITRPKLQWEMELDLYDVGDESGAAVRMLALIEKNLGHPSVKAWNRELTELLAPISPSQTYVPEVAEEAKP